jgi:uncharacterized protein (DUF924 family)
MDLLLCLNFDNDCCLSYKVTIGKNMGNNFDYEVFQRLPFVVKALENPRSPRSVLNYMCACDTQDPKTRELLSTEEKVAPLLNIWFASGSELDKLCQPFASVVRELKADPPTLIGHDWDALEGKFAKLLLADQLSRSCFRGTLEAFSFDSIGQELARELVMKETLKETLKLPTTLLYLLPWALAHSESLQDLDRALEIIDMATTAYPNFNLFEGRNKQAVSQHRQVLEKFGRYPQRNKEFGRKNTAREKEWLEDKDNLPIWAGGKLSIDQFVK